MNTKTFTISGTHCHACKALIEDVSLDVDGVLSCTVDFNTGLTTLEHDDSLNWNVYKQEIESLGSYEIMELS